MNFEKKQALREGKAKILFTTSRQDCLIQHFKDDATAFNAQKRGTIVNKGVVNNAVSSWVFQFLGKNGVPTHFVEKVSDRDMAVKKVEIIPVETVVRNRAAGSICKRLGVEKGRAFETPLVEWFYKSDELGDPVIGEGHIFYFKWATEAELAEMRRLALRVNELMRAVFEDIGLELIDFKLEFGRCEGRVILADEFTPDGCRLWDRKTGEPMDKDRFRQDLGGVEEAYQEVFRRLEQYFAKTKH